MSKKERQEVKVNFPQELVGGVYSNNMLITHTREEFILDFMMVAPPTGAVTSRVILSPGHLKRAIAALQENLKKYEARFGEVASTEAPDLPDISGFEPQSRH